VEQFSNGYVLYSVFLNVEKRDPDTLLQLFEALKDDASVLCESDRVRAMCACFIDARACTTDCLPRTSLSPLIKSHRLSQQEHVYAYCGWKFAYHFLSRLAPEYADIARSLPTESLVRVRDRVCECVDASSCADNCCCIAKVEIETRKGAIARLRHSHHQHVCVCARARRSRSPRRACKRRSWRSRRCSSFSTLTLPNCTRGHRLWLGDRAQ
jgi:hypothetical protein